MAGAPESQRNFTTAQRFYLLCVALDDICHLALMTISTCDVGSSGEGYI